MLCLSVALCSGVYPTRGAAALLLVLLLSAALFACRAGEPPASCAVDGSVQTALSLLGPLAVLLRVCGVLAFCQACCVCVLGFELLRLIAEADTVYTCTLHPPAHHHVGTAASCSLSHWRRPRPVVVLWPGPFDTCFIEMFVNLRLPWNITVGGMHCRASGELHFGPSLLAARICCCIAACGICERISGRGTLLHSEQLPGAELRCVVACLCCGFVRTVRTCDSAVAREMGACYHCRPGCHSRVEGF